MSDSTMGHVFVTWGDLTSLACDGWLLPTDLHHDVEDSFRSAVEGARWPERSAAWQRGEVRACVMPDWDETRAPVPWFTNMGGTDESRIEWYLGGVREFVRKASQRFDGRSPFLGRTLPLLAVPVVGIRHGGAGHKAGDVIEALLRELRQLASDEQLPAFDIALVAFSAPAFAAAQSIRRRDGNSWPELDESLRRKGDELASSALRNRLVLFIGAGVSVAARAPGWRELLLKLAADVGLTDEEQEDLRGLGELDAATVIERRATPARGKSARQVLGEKIRQYVDLPRPSLMHTMLAALPVRQAVTTNYDRMFEIACGAMKDRVSILPYSPDPEARRWLLKLHGCVTRVEDIVLTREDYLRYEQQRAALAGIVQALLITHQLLFVGFSLTDDNFHRIADAVRRALRPYGAESNPAWQFGTALALDSRPVRKALWGDDLNWIAMASENERRPKSEDEARGWMQGLARKQEIFLDYVLAQATTASNHLLKPGFEGMLDDAQLALRDRLIELARMKPERSDAAWDKVQELLVALGQGEPAQEP